ncbi:putative 2og-fe oxygenase family protein [Phaeomoniella chlamydospora]|uniref:Putative 2og-fe oxygenase family protein n=1 Tax=Phaeomoniella chlamydospora TaxID=158046 RepID=A0A0G2E848_PHACM|nr:putative 2og-fe oxygenase family protein [Phaeomoniella chlamydospora]
MTAETVAEPSAEYTQLRLASANGPVYRSVKRTPLRDALPSEIPLIDVSGIFSDSFTERKAVADQVHAAATNNGFFYIKSHGIPSDVTESAYQACLDFFRQPSSIKNMANAQNSQFYNGWKPPQSQRINDVESIDVRETFSWTYNPRYDPAVTDVSAIPPNISECLRVEETHWEATSNVPHFKASIVQYWQSCLSLARALVHTFALSLSLPESYLDSKFTHPDAALALNYYPPIPEPLTQSSEEQVSIGSHTDFQLFTILWQDRAGGLQVLNRDGQWINAKPIDGTFVVNIGDYLQRITNDKYVSTVHRAQNRSGGERVSMPFFFGFNLNEKCGVLESCCGKDDPPKYEEVSCKEWVERRVRAMHRTEKER